MIEPTDIILRLPGNAPEIWEKLVNRGIYIGPENERDLFHAILRNQEDLSRFLNLFDHQLVVHRKDFAYAEDRKQRRLLKGHEQLLVFLAVFIEKYQKLHASPRAPWYEEITRTVQTLGSLNPYSTETAQRRLQEAGLHDEWDIYDKVLKPAAAQCLIHIGRHAQDRPVDAATAKVLEFKFNNPVHRFIDLFSELPEFQTDFDMTSASGVAPNGEMDRDGDPDGGRGDG